MSYKGISLTQIEYFLSVAENLSFTEAAKQMYTTQPSLSRQISKMEKQLGVALFYRTKRAIRLTPEGVILYNELNGVTTKINNALKVCLKPSIEEQSTLYIGCYDTMDTGVYLTEIINGFKRTYPKVEFVIERHSFIRLREKLESGELDVIFTLSFEVDGSPEIITDELCKHDTCVLMSKDHPLAGQENITLKDFEHETFIMLNPKESPSGYKGIIEQCKKSGFSPVHIKHVSNSESVLMTVESGAGVAVVETKIRIFREEKFAKVMIEDDWLYSVMAWKSSNFNPAVALLHNYVISEIESKEN